MTLDFYGMIATISFVVLVPASCVIWAESSKTSRLIVAALAGLWTGLAAAAANAGWLTLPSEPPIIAFFVATPVLAAAVAALSSRGVRAALLSLPLALIVGLHSGRIFAVLFLQLEEAGRLGGPFPFYAGWGDILTGVAAIPLAMIALKAEKPSGPLMAAFFVWNLFGIADLVLAIFLGVTSAEGSPLQMFFTAPGSQAMQTLPFSFVPTVLVPFYLVLHGVVWANLMSGAGKSGRIYAAS